MMVAVANGSGFFERPLLEEPGGVSAGLSPQRPSHGGTLGV